MKKHSILIRLAALLAAVSCLIPTALAEQPEETQEETQYIVTDGPSAHSDLAFGSVCVLNGCAAPSTASSPWEDRIADWIPLRRPLPLSETPVRWFIPTTRI